MGTYLYSGPHTRQGTIHVQTFFPLLGGRPVVAMKASIVIDGESQQRTKVDKLQSLLYAYEQFLIPKVHKTSLDYDYALLVENLDNTSVPEKVANRTSNPGDCVMGIIIDYDALHDTYTLGCGPAVYRNITSDLYIDPHAEFTSVQIQIGKGKFINNVYQGKATVKRLLDPVASAAAVSPCVSALPSPNHSSKQTKKVNTPEKLNSPHTPSPQPQAQSKAKKSNKSKATTPTASPSEKSPAAKTPKKKTSQGTKAKPTRGAVSMPSLQPKKNTPFVPFTGWSATLNSSPPSTSSTQNNLNNAPSSSQRSLAYSNEDLSDSSELDFDPFVHYLQILERQKKMSGAENGESRPSTSSSTLSNTSLHPKPQKKPTKSNIKPSTRPHSPSPSPHRNLSSVSRSSSTSSILSNTSLYVPPQKRTTKSKTESSTNSFSPAPSIQSNLISTPSSSRGSLANSEEEDTDAIPESYNNPSMQRRGPSLFDILTRQTEMTETRSRESYPSTSSSSPLKNNIEPAASQSPTHSNLIDTPASSRSSLTCAEEETKAVTQRDDTPVKKRWPSFFSLFTGQIKKSESRTSTSSSTLSNTSKIKGETATSSPSISWLSTFINSPTRSRGSLACTEEDPDAIPDPDDDPFMRRGTSLFTDLIRDPGKRNGAKSSAPEPSTSSSSLSYTSLCQVGATATENSKPNPACHTASTSTSDVSRNAAASRASSPSSISDFDALKPTLSPSERGNTPVVDSTFSLEEFDALKPTLSAVEKGNKAVEDFMIVTIGSM